MVRGVTSMAALGLLSAGLVVAQDEAPATTYVYASYFICDPAGESRADEAIARNFKPHYDAAVEAGNIVSWSWLAHYVGGQWRRVHVISATNMDDLLDSSGALGEIIEENTPEAGRAFTEVCPTHVDYIWESIEGASSGTVGAERGDAGFSMYFECDITREERADKLVIDNFAPVYNRYVESGELASWGWLKHNVGGPHRRLLTMTAATHKDLSHVRDKLNADLRAGRNERYWREIGEICDRHEDYMWDIRLETP